MKNLKTILNIACIATTLFFASCSNNDVSNQISVEDFEVTIDENPTNGDIVGTVETMQTHGGGNLAFSITTQTPEGALNISASTGELTVADATLFDFETNPQLTATVKVDGATNTGTVTINLTNLEVSVQNLMVTMDENPTSGQSVGTVITNGNGTLNFSITSQTPVGALNIDVTTGVLTVADATVFDFETNPVITATISDGEAVTPATVTINLTNINEITVQDLAVTIDENPTKGQSIGKVVANGNGALNFSITTQTPAGALNIDANTGELTVVDVNLFDFERNPIIKATITVNDGIAPATITINLNDLAEGAKIGDFRDGGVVFWVDPTDSNHGLVVAINNQNSAAWGCQGTSTGATGSDIGKGKANTTAINTICATTGIAAYMATNYDGTSFSDWFLPSRDELLELHSNKDIVNTTAVANGGSAISTIFYWSSTENGINNAYVVSFSPGNSGTSGNSAKSNSYGVRAIRAF